MLSTSRALHGFKQKGKRVCCIQFKKSYTSNCLRKRENEEIVYSKMDLLAARGRQQQEHQTRFRLTDKDYGYLLRQVSAIFQPIPELQFKISCM
jgi:hypothetical protein